MAHSQQLIVAGDKKQIEPQKTEAEPCKQALLGKMRREKKNYSKAVSLTLVSARCDCRNNCNIRHETPHEKATAKKFAVTSPRLTSRVFRHSARRYRLPTRNLPFCLHLAEAKTPANHGIHRGLYQKGLKTGLIVRIALIGTRLLLTDPRTHRRRFFADMAQFAAEVEPLDLALIVLEGVDHDGLLALELALEQ
ncbi:MAG: hypothetical protein WD030_03365, partial [Pirellulales bacterium]